MDIEKIETALRKSRKYIRTVEALKYDCNMSISTLELIAEWTEGDEIKSIEDALLELGVIV